MLFFEIAVMLVSYLAFPVLFFGLYWLWKSQTKTAKILTGLGLILTLIFIWARFIETNIIQVQTTKIQTGFGARIALISDTHLGIYKDKGFLTQVVDQINTQKDLDAVLIAGDFTYEPEIKELDRLFAPLGSLKYPTYAIFGNHDVEQPGPKLRNELQVALEKANVKVLNNQVATIKNFELFGIGELYAREDQPELLNQFEATQNVIVLAHNPDIVDKLPSNKADLTLSGHTHCGQIRIPFIYKFFIPVVGGYDKGLTSEKNSQLFITCGVGEVGLPMRLFNPPTIDILELF
jgi:predicted MPP superfamily phosphohydrolase